MVATGVVVVFVITEAYSIVLRASTPRCCTMWNGRAFVP
jgi:hypothetical protein